MAKVVNNHAAGVIVSWLEHIVHTNTHCAKTKNIHIHSDTKPHTFTQAFASYCV